jgi:hypothetical protein
LKRFFGVAVLAAAFLANGAAAFPQSQPAAMTPHLSLTPAVVVATGKFGQSLTQPVTLDNGTPQSFNFVMEAQDVVVRDGKRVYVPAGQLPNSVAATAVFSQRGGIVPALTSKTVLVRLTIPNQTKIRAVVITFHNTNVIASHGVVSFAASLSGLITFTLSDDIAVETSAVFVKPATASTNLRIVERMVNSGTEPVIPEGVAALVGQNGALAAKFPFESQRLLPGEHGTFAAEYAGQLKPGTYRVVCTFQFEGKTVTNAGQYTQR